MCMYQCCMCVCVSIYACVSIMNLNSSGWNQHEFRGSNE